MTLALPAVFAACTNDAIEGDVQQNGGRELLSKDFSIVASKTWGAESRGQWFKDGTYKFNWKNATAAADKIGLCWTGVATAADGTDVSVANPSNMALSNYSFVMTHYTNGKSGGDYAESEWLTEKAGGFANAEDLNNYITAKFSMTGATPFTGKYVMYYPYSEDLKNVGYLPVSVPANQTMAGTMAEQLVNFGAMTLCISEPYTFDSSTSTTDVEMNPYTTAFLPRMIKSDATGATDVTVKRIMLVAADGKNIVNEQTLDLDGTVKTSKGVTVMTLNTNEIVNASATAETPKEVLMAVLPQTLKLGEFELLFVNANSKAYSYPLTKDLTFNAGTVSAPTVKLDGRNFTMDIITDETALKAAINEATESTKTVSTYKNVPVTFASAADFTNTKKVTVNAEKIIFNGTVSFGGDIEFTCPVEFNGAVTVDEGVTVTLADGSVLNSTIALTAGADADHITTLNLKATTITNVLTVNAANAAINFTSGTSELNAVFTVGANQTVNVKNGATVNVNVEGGLTNNGTVNVEQGGALVVAAKYTEGLSVIEPSIANAANLNVNGTLTNNSVINNTGTFMTDGNGVINNNLTINNSGNIVLMQSDGVALSQGTGATVEDGGNISGISRISGGDLVVKIDGTNTLESALANLKYNNHTAFRITIAQTVTNLVNTTKKLILQASLTLNGSDSEADNATGSIEILNDASITSVDKLNVTGDITIAASKQLTVETGTNISVSGKIYNNGTFYIATPADSYVYCNGIVTGTGATWNPTPQW